MSPKEPELSTYINKLAFANLAKYTVLKQSCQRKPKTALFRVITLSRGNLACPNEAKVILWEPTRQKLLERRGLRAVGAVPEGQSSSD